MATTKKYEKTARKNQLTKEEIIDVPVEVGKIYEYVCSWQRPLYKKPRGAVIAPTWQACLISPGEEFMVIERLQKTVSYIKIYVIRTGRIGWMFTGFTNGYYMAMKYDTLSKVMQKIV